MRGWDTAPPEMQLERAVGHLLVNKYMECAAAAPLCRMREAALHDVGFDGRSNGESVPLPECAFALQPTDNGLGTVRWRILQADDHRCYCAIARYVMAV